jgi:hypothetical protein
MGGWSENLNKAPAMKVLATSPKRGHGGRKRKGEGRRSTAICLTARRHTALRVLKHSGHVTVIDVTDRRCSLLRRYMLRAFSLSLVLLCYCMNCTQSIPANPDISGAGIRVAIYVQNVLSFIPAFWALRDGKIDQAELETVERQSTTILITAFAILISAIIQVTTFSLSRPHASIILSLSWMNNTNTFIYFLLYISHKSDPDRQEERVLPQWSTWIMHCLGLIIPRTRGTTNKSSRMALSHSWKSESLMKNH